MIGKTLGHYEITSRLGKGGMGEVYRAKDSKLGRDVAIKVLPEEFARDAERVARFRREAKLLASLNHPNIASIYGLEESGGTNFLVLELVEGDTLAQRLSKGPLPIDEALGICKQIAEGLEAAHDKGVIHRDLKPANVMITDGDKVKILDFGLAKALADETQAIDSSQSPTLTEAMTRPGVILGTAAYMSPEQAKGKSVDKRADIWAFGCILYECLTGKRVFEGETVTETLAAILKGEPDWPALPAITPPNIRFVLRRCLEKVLSRRFHCAADLRIVIEEARDLSPPQAAPPIARTGWKAVALVLTGLIVIAAIGGAALWSLRPATPAKVIQFPLVLPDDQAFTATANYLVAISPDGASLAYVANNQLYLRRLSEAESRPIAGTNQDARSPFFSPDGQWIGYFSYQDMALMKIAITGGVAVELCKAGPPWGLTWQGDTIVFGQRGRGILSVSSNGGTPEVWFKSGQDELASSPQILPGGDAILFALLKSAGGATSDDWDKADIVAYSRKTGIRKTLVKGGSSPRYLPTGHIIYALGTNLMMTRLDVARLEVTGGSTPILAGVMRATGIAGGAANFDFSADGTLVYVPGGSAAVTNPQLLALVDRNGKRDVLGLPSGPYDFPRLSPDGKQLAVVTNEGGRNVCIYEMSGKSALRRLTFEGSNSFPVWSPDGKQLAFYSNRENKPGIFLQAADGTGAAERLGDIPAADEYLPSSWSRDGTLAFTARIIMQYKLWTVALAGERKAELFLDGRTLVHPAFSPDGHWVAYVYVESMHSNIYVQPFPKTSAARYQITQKGRNDAPLWSPDGKELFFYNSESQKLMAVSIQTQPAFSFGQPVPLPIEGITQNGGGRRYDITPDGKRFLVMLPDTSTKGKSRHTQQVNVVLNWFEELKKIQGKQ